MTERLRVLADLITSCDEGAPCPYVALEHLESGTGRLVRGLDLPELKNPGTGVVSVQPGDVLFGKLRPYLAKTWLVDRRAYASTELLCLRPRPGVDSRWLSYVCASRPLVDWAVATSDGTKMPRTGWDKLHDYRVTVPEQRQQRAIAYYLDAETARIDALMEKKQRMVELLDHRLHALAFHLTTRYDRTVPLRRLALQVKTGTTPNAFVLERLLDGALPWYSPGDVEEWLGLAEPARSLAVEAVTGGWVPRFERNSTLVVGIGATAGRVAHLESEASGNQQMTCIVSGPLLVPRFLSWQLFSRAAEMKETAPYTTLPIINNGFLKSVSIFLPPLDVQEAVVRQLDDEARRAKKLLAALYRQHECMREHRQALITAAITGQLSVPGMTA